MIIGCQPDFDATQVAEFFAFVGVRFAAADTGLVRKRCGYMAVLPRQEGPCGCPWWFRDFALAGRTSWKCPGGSKKERIFGA